jgi:serine protease AprX
LRCGISDSWGESRASGLWGGSRGGNGGGRGSKRRVVLALVLLALGAPLAAGAGNKHAGGSYLAPALTQVAQSTPDRDVPVIVMSDKGAGGARKALDDFADSTTRLPIVDGAAADVRAGDLPELAESPGLAIVPDQPVALDGLGGGKHVGNAPYSSTELWPSAVGVDQLWPALQARKPGGGLGAPTIAFVDSGIQAGRTDFGDRVLAQVNLTSLPGNSPGDGRGHGTFIAGLAAGSAPRHVGAAPTAGIVSIDVMDDQGMARTSDVIAGAQWILQNHNQYNIRVANFSLHSETPSSFRWDPLDKAIERLWFSGVVVVTSAGNEGVDGQQMRIASAPANDPFVITVGALDLRGSASADRASVPDWSSWGYTYDGFAKPELSAPGRSLLGPIPASATLAQQRPAQLVHSSDGLYMRLSGTSLSAPIVSGIAADILALHPRFTPDEVKGALMLGARPVTRARSFSAGVGEPWAPLAASFWSPPNPNRALDAFVVPDPAGGPPEFDDAAWLAAVQSSPSWDTVSWSDGWDSVAWSLVSWSDVSWSDVSWSDVSWSDVSWSDVSWNDVSWADSVYGDVDP